MEYSHVKAHQDDRVAYQEVYWPSQLNCQMGYYAKKAIWEYDTGEKGETQQFLLKPLSISIDHRKLTSDTRGELKFWLHKQIAKEFFHKRSILFDREFNVVDWEMVSQALKEVPQMFQIWACKQVMNCAS